MTRLLSWVACLFVCMSAVAQTVAPAADTWPAAQRKAANRAAAECSSVRESASPTPETLEADIRNARDRGFLWRITKDGRTSFLYGTLHAGKSEWMVPGPNVTGALRSADALALEMDVLDPDIQQRLAAGMAALRRTELPESLVKRLQDQSAALCVPYDSIGKLTPEFQIVTLTMMVGRSDGLEAAYAVDLILAGLGHAAQKEVVSLETPELQLQVLQMQSPQESIAFVEDGLNELETGRARTMLARVASAWANGDYAELDRFGEWCECLDTEIERAMMKRTLDDRNPRLAAEIDELHSSGKHVFAAVGSLHMFGPLGLPTLMEKRGYRVERVVAKRQ
jgi:uncharacterized protein YbaP (TraB family)